ncbi:hypothetical protein J4232_00875 [Candidatus Woesearchaeota archaeon]|nr:hypothetical protein [Candidatus Woesearchaeota archaeon]
MLKFYFSPEWFHGIDSIFEIVSIIVALLIALYAYKIYKFSKVNKYKFFSWAFLLIAIAYIFKILTNLTLYKQNIIEKTIGNLTFTFLTVQKTELFLVWGYLLFHFFMIIGLIGIYLVIDKQAKEQANKKIVILLTFLAFLSAILSHFYFIIFHITNILVLSFITMIFYNNCRKKCTKATKLITSAFFLVLISQIFFIMILFNPNYYVLGEIVQLIGFIILLISYFMVLKK